MAWLIRRNEGIENDLKTKLKRICEYKMLKQNKDLVLAYDREGSLNGRKIGTRYSELMTLDYLCQFAGNKAFKSFTKEDVVRFIDDVKNRRFQDRRFRAKFKANVEQEVSESTLNLHKHIVRKFLCYVHGADKNSYPECVKWIKVNTICGREKSPEDMLTSDEIKAIISATENPRDRAVISLMAESGARLGEIITARIRDVMFSDRGFKLAVDGKTGKRTIPLYSSKTDLKEWLNNYHPFKNDHDAPLFISYTKKSKRTNMTREGIARILRIASSRARIRKKVYPHLFRHTKASELARLGWTEPMLKKFFGWTKNSNMPSIYVHLAETDIEDRYYEMYGRAKTKRESRPQMTPESFICPSCNKKNPTGFIFCFNCNKPLNGTSTKIAKGTKILDFIVSDGELRRQFSALLEMAFKKKHADQSFP